MYTRDLPIIRDHALASPEGLMDVIEFVLCTIQQPLQSISRQRQDIAEKGAESVCLFGSKRDGWKYAQKNIGYLWRVMHDILKRQPSVDREADLVMHFMQVPGLGTVKAAFVVQMVGGEVACLDVHNLKALGISAQRFKVTPKLKAETARKKIMEYLKVCSDTGGSEYWWNRWCEYVAGRRGSPLKTGDAVSAYHVSAILA